MLRKKLISTLCVSALIGATSIAFAGAYGEAEQPEEIRAPSAALDLAQIPEPGSAPRVMRQFENFATDAETSRGVWFEFSSLYYADDGSSSAVSNIGTLAYGQEMFELGLQLPYEVANRDDNDEHGLGDLDLYGKVIPLRTERLSLGGGLVVHAPTGDAPLFSADEWGFNPFVTGALSVGKASLRATVGYDVYQDIDDLDEVTWNVAGLLPVVEKVVLRGELDAAHATHRNVDEDPVRFVPGVDVTFPLGVLDLVLRLTGSVGINDSETWGLGLGIALVQSARG